MSSLARRAALFVALLSPGTALSPATVLVPGG